MIVLQHHLAKSAPRLPQDRRRGCVGGYPTCPKRSATTNDERGSNLPPKAEVEPPHKRNCRVNDAQLLMLQCLIGQLTTLEQMYPNLRVPNRTCQSENVMASAEP
jgi:hypothetical protein